MKISQSARHAIYIGTLCSVAYFAVYIARNILSAVTPQMVEFGYTEEYIGSVSSATGFLDFLSYSAAAAANKLFSGAIDAIGWEKLIIVWLMLVASGVFVALPYSKFKKIAN